MALSVGLGRIVPDPEASTRVRNALAILSDPRLLVTDKAITIDDEGRVVLRIAENMGLLEDENGLSLKIEPNKGLEVTEDGLAIKLAPGGGIASGPDGLEVDISFPWTRFITAEVGVTLVTASPSWDYSFSVPGAVVGDCVVVSPILTPTTEIGAWSGLVSAPNTVTIRTMTGVVGAGSSQAFKVLVIGVT